MSEKAPQQFASPEEEIEYLRKQIAEKEKTLSDPHEVSHEGSHEIAKAELFKYGTFTPDSVLKGERIMPEEDVVAEANYVAEAADSVKEVLALANEKGIRNALSVLEKMNDPHLVDEVHRELIEMVRAGKEVKDLQKDVPPWKVLHMTLYEITLPEFKTEEGKQEGLTELVAMMEQFYSGMRGVGYGEGKDHYTLEIAVSNDSEDIIFYAAIPNEFLNLFEKQILSLFPRAELNVREHDYNIFNDDEVALVSVAGLKKHPIFPLRTDDEFDTDPLSVLLNAFSKIERDGSGAAVQLMIRSTPNKHSDSYQNIMKRVEKGMPVHEAIQRESLGGEIFASFKEFVFGYDEKGNTFDQQSDTDKMDLFRKKIEQPIVEANLRIAVSAPTKHEAEAVLHEIESTFNQYEEVRSNKIIWSRPSGSVLRRELKAFSFREWLPKDTIALSLTELATFFHLPEEGVEATPQFKQKGAKTAAAPSEMPESGTLLGINKHRGMEKKIFISEKDRMRHFYIIGQTGTGKSVFMKNIIIQDIEAGHGVCMIDPHGTDIEDVLAVIPPERVDDVIYFDPANMEHVVGLNMLEYDQEKPEQKTFVVNELFSIFQKLYGAVPESMGPMFEQYFRNATLLVMEDPESGNTLMDISRVMSDSEYRRYKLEKATNPVVVRFWQDIATKAGGEASLENIVPYIVSKFDVFTANDYMRPIIGQQKSSFNFRNIMDEKKILLVNLSKGRLGDINANLIGMIVVGKILMAALSRVDDSTKSFPDFYLHIDEFQNISTPAIASILSEARKYKLGLTIAHQFIAQLDEDIRDAVFGNVGSLAAFRVGQEDGEFLAQQFSPVFEERDLINIPNYQAYLRVLADGTPKRPFSISAMPPPEVSYARVAELMKYSAEKYARPRTEVEEEIKERYRKPQISEKENPFAGIM